MKTCWMGGAPASEISTVTRASRWVQVLVLSITIKGSTRLILIFWHSESTATPTRLALVISWILNKMHCRLLNWTCCSPAQCISHILHVLPYFIYLCIYFYNEQHFVILIQTTAALRHFLFQQYICVMLYTSVYGDKVFSTSVHC